MVVKVPNIPGRAYTNSKIRITVTQEEITIEYLVKPKPKIQTFMIPEDGAPVPGDMRLQSSPVQPVYVPQYASPVLHGHPQPQVPEPNDLAAKMKKAKRTVDGITDLLGFGDK